MLSLILRFFIFLSPAVPHEIMKASHLKEVAYFRWTRKLSCRCDLLREQLGAGVNRIVETKDTRNSLLGYVNKKGGFFEFSRILTHSSPANPTTAPIAVLLLPLWELRSRLKREVGWTSTAGNWALRVWFFFVVEVFCWLHFHSS